MKELPSDHCRPTPEDLFDHDHDNETPVRNLEGKDRPKWYAMLPYDEFVPHIPKLRHIRGSKAKVHIDTFDETSKVCQQIFECNKSFFRFRAQVDLLAHYLGTKILEQIYVVRAGKSKDPLSEILEEMEPQYIIWDQMKTVKDIFKDLCEKLSQNVLSESEFLGYLSRYVRSFALDENGKKMEKIILEMLEKSSGEEEVKKIKERLRKREYRQKAKAQGIGVVGEE